MGKQYFNPQDVAEILGISKQTLFRYERKGIFPKPMRNLINKWRQYTHEEVKELKKILGRI